MNKNKRLLACLLAVALVLGMISIGTVSTAANEPSTVGAMLDAYRAAYGNTFNHLTGNAALRDQARADAAATLAAWEALPSDAARDAAVNGVQTQTLIALFFEAARIRPDFPGGTAIVNGQFVLDYVQTRGLATPSMMEGLRLGRTLFGQLDNSQGLRFGNNAATFTGANAANIQAWEDLGAAYRALPNIAFYTMLGMQAAAPHGFIGWNPTVANSLLGRAFDLHRFYLMASQGITNTVQATFTALDTVAAHFGLPADIAEGLSILAEARLGLETMFASMTFGATETSLNMDVSGLSGLQERWDALFVGNSHGLMVNAWALSFTAGTGNHNVGPALRVGSNAAGAARTATWNLANIRQHLLAGSIGGLYRLGTIDTANPDGAEVARIIRALEGNGLSAAIQQQYMDTAAIASSAVNRRLEAIRPFFAPEGRPDRDTTRPSTSGWTSNRSGNILQRALIIIVRNIANPMVLNATNEIELFTNETVTALISLNAAMFDVLENEIEQLSAMEQGVIRGLVNVAHNTNMSVEVLANLLFEDEYADIVAHLRSIQNAGNGGWDAFDPYAFNFDWGVIPGDRDSFTTAAIAVLRPVARLLTHGAGRTQPLTQNTSVGQLLDMVAGDGSWIGDGHYELSIIPLLESLNARGVATADELNQAVFAANSESADPRLFQDALTAVLIEPLLNLVEDLLEDPLNTLLDIIPNFAYFVTQGRLDNFFNNWQLRFSLEFIDVPINSADEILGLLLGAVFGENFDMPDIDWDFIATLGTRAVRPSANGTTVYSTYIRADRVGVMREVVLSAADLLVEDSNANALASMLNMGISGQDLIGLASAIQSRNIFSIIISGIRLAFRLM